MKTTNLTFILVFFFQILSYSQTFPPGYSRLNFECGGYATEIIPSTYPDLIYVRTDVGGVYKSYDNGNNWTFICNDIFTSPASLMVQGLAVRSEEPNTVVICCGSSEYPNDPGKGVYVTFNGGNNWTHPINYINFSGNGGEDFNKKIGGECVVFGDNHEFVLFGGRGSGLYKYNIYGDSLILLADPSIIQGNISTIVQNGDEIWVGSDQGVWKSTNAGLSFDQIFNYWDIGGIVYRIVSAPDGVIYLTCYNYGDENNGFLMSTDGGGSWSSLISNFELNPYTLDNIMVGLSVLNTVIDNGRSFYRLMASRMANPTKVAYVDNGIFQWVTLDLPVVPESRPQHFLFNQYDLNIFYSKSNFCSDGAGTQYYCSGGSAPLRTGNIEGTWEYIPNGMSMTVVYKVYFNPATYVNDPNYNIYIPISDWTMAKTSYINSQNFNKLSYARTLTRPDPNSDTYIPNVTRVLISGNTMTHYLIGGNVYEPRNGAICKTTDDGQSYQLLTAHPAFYADDRALIDGVISTYYSVSSSTDALLVLLGKSKGSANPIDDLGLYYSLDNGNTFDRSDFYGLDGSDENTMVQYEHSLIGVLDVNGTQLPALFSTHFGLGNGPNGNDPNNDFKYLYLPGDNLGSDNGGGFFYSTNAGQNWQWDSWVVGESNYRDQGCLCVRNDGRVYLAIRNLGGSGQIGGLYYSDDPISEGTDHWQNKNSLVYSAEQVDALIDGAGNNILVIFGKMSRDTYNKIYFSLNEGASWSEITNADYRIPTVRSLTINPHNTNEVWIGTGGQGVFVYSGLLSDSKDRISAKHEFDFRLKQNYPNPFNPVTNISFELPIDSKVMLKIYDILGREVATLVDEFKPAGIYSVKFDGSGLSTGVYFYKLESRYQTIVKKMILIK